MESKFTIKRVRFLGLKKEDDENGDLITNTLNCEKLFSYFNSDKYCSDNADFISPVIEGEQASLFGNDFLKDVISFFRDTDETLIPVYYKKKMFPNVEKGIPVQKCLLMHRIINE